MTKRKAMLLAAGLVASLLGGAVAMALGLSGAGSAVADTPKRLDPIVKVRERTVKIEKQAKGSDRPVQVVNLGGTTEQQGGGDPSESGSESYESEDHGSETEDHSTEDHSTEDHGDESGDD
ncbi:MAG TPA: hypothetical protein VFT27_01690 [Actinomycetota bacterium]|nr:hypothetical protein [Actinomycetota bacterium]